MTERRRLTAEDLLALKLAGDVQIHPDGTKVLYTLQEINAEANEYRTALWLAEEGKEPIRLTGGTHDSTPRWSPDGTLIAFLSRRSGSTQIWILPAQGGEAYQLTKIKGGVGAPVWSPDSRTIAFSVNLGPKGIQPEGQEESQDLFAKHTAGVKVIDRLFYKLDGTGYFGDKRSHVAIVPVTDRRCAGAPTPESRLLTDGDFDHGQPAWAPDGSGLYLSALRRADADSYPQASNLWFFPLTGEPVQLTDGTDLAASSPTPSPDGQTVAFLGSLPAEQGYGLTGLYLLDRQGGAIRQLAPNLDRGFVNEVIVDMPAPGGHPLTWAPDGRSLFAPVSDAGQVHLVQVDAASGAVQAITGGDKVVYSYSLTPDTKRAALAYATPASPGDVYLARLTEKAPTSPTLNAGTVLTGGGVHEVQLSAHNQAHLAGLDLTRPERYQFRASEGEPLVDGWILPPVGLQPGEKVPAILEIHGGPMGMYGCGFMYEFHLMAAAGYGVIFTNPRGSQGYGREFCMSIMGDWGDKDYRDCLVAVDTACATAPWIDPARVGVGGGSYGGFMVNWIVGHTNRFKAAVTGRPVVNRHSAMGTSDTGYNRIGQFGTDNWWEPEKMGPYLKQSPLVHAHKVETPLLIEAQEGDLRCPIEQAEQFYIALKMQGKTVRFIRYPNEFHGMSRTGKPWHRIHRLKAINAWFDEYLR
ncbi:MAG TPA: S9 family peptidase [Symbiobacteriaceae bacterium]|nr:S9 family peptidase [Symbiobacteriaceae bacterium]